MHWIIQDFKSIDNFAKVYQSSKKKGIGVTRQAMRQLVNREIESPGTTGLDVMEIDGKIFVRYQDETGPKVFKCIESTATPQL